MQTMGKHQNSLRITLPHLRDSGGKLVFFNAPELNPMLTKERIDVFGQIKKLKFHGCFSAACPLLRSLKIGSFQRPKFGLRLRERKY